MPVVSRDLTIPFTISGGNTRLGEQLYERLLPWMNPSLETYVNAIGAMFEPLVTVIEGAEDESEWGAVLSPGSFPNTEASKSFPYTFNPQYLAQFVGVTLPLRYNFTEAMNTILEEPESERGTLASIETAIARLSAAGSTPRISERTNANGEVKPYRFVVSMSARELAGTITKSGTVTSASKKLTALTSTTGIEAGAEVTALGVPVGATVVAIPNGTEVELSQASTITETNVEIIFVNPATRMMIESAVNSKKPAGLQWTLLLGGIYSELESHFATYKAVEEAFASYATLELEGS